MRKGSPLSTEENSEQQGESAVRECSPWDVPHCEDFENSEIVHDCHTLNTEHGGNIISPPK